MEWIAYTSFFVGLVVVACALLYLFLKFKRDAIQDILDCKQSVFNLFKEVYHLTLEKSIHDEKVNGFIVELQAPQDNSIAPEKLNQNLIDQGAKFRNLLAKENFLGLCRERILELISILSARNDKSMELIIRLLGLDKNETEFKNKKKENIVQLLFSKARSNLPSLIAELKEKVSDLRGNKNLLIHSFATWERAVREKIVALERGMY
ncbi:hypothetical protein WEN_00560 [Mycoplasma wenyonii str. Massachusetts]|uniref:Uncharacterized protein n=2 Tax=Mycoplasma wenyonii TaxID=65123 RepID=I6YL05_MYCWM|nr:hypothetical protein WEN_00560 [Mycoplasma wenyonii str. Massachusetts]